MENYEALKVLKTEEALHKKMTVKQFVSLALVTIVFPVIIIISVGSSL